MPILQDKRQVKEVILPNTGVTVKIKDGIIAGDIKAIQNVTDKVQSALLLLTKLIVEWDATDEAGNKLPVTVENLEKLDFQDINAMESQLEGIKNFLAQTTSGQTQ